MRTFSVNRLQSNLFYILHDKRLSSTFFVNLFSMWSSVFVLRCFFQKGGMLYFKLNRRKLHDDKKKSNVISIGDHIYPLDKTLSNQIRLDKSWTFEQPHLSSGQKLSRINHICSRGWLYPLFWTTGPRTYFISTNSSLTLVRDSSVVRRHYILLLEPSNDRGISDYACRCRRLRQVP